MGNHIPSWSWARRERLPHPPRGHPSNAPSTTMCWRLPAPCSFEPQAKRKKKEEKICTVIQSFQITSPFMRSHNSAEDRGLPVLSSTASCCPLPAPHLLQRPVPTLCRLQQPRGLCERQEKRLRPCHRQAGWPLSPLFASALLTVCGGCPNRHGCTPFASFPLPFPWCLPGFQPPSASPAADDLILTSQHLFNALLGAEELCLVAAMGCSTGAQGWPRGRRGTKAAQFPLHITQASPRVKSPTSQHQSTQRTTQKAQCSHQGPSVPFWSCP